MGKESELGAPPEVARPEAGQGKSKSEVVKLFTKQLEESKKGISAEYIEKEKFSESYSWESEFSGVEWMPDYLERAKEEQDEKEKQDEKEYHKKNRTQRWYFDSMWKRQEMVRNSMYTGEVYSQMRSASSAVLEEFQPRVRNHKEPFENDVPLKNVD